MPWSLIMSLGKQFGPYLFGALGLLAVYLYWDGRSDTIISLQLANTQLEAQLMTEKASYELNLASLNGEIADTKRQVINANTRYNDLEQTAAIAKTELEAKLQLRIKNLNDKISLLDAIPTPQTCEGAMDLIITVAEKNPWPLK